MQHLRCLRLENVMARTTLALLSANVAVLEGENAELRAEVKRLNDHIRHDTVDVAEYRRVQGVLRTTQSFAAKYKKEARGTGNVESTKRPYSERCKAYFAATGERSVTPTKLLAWEQANA